MDAWKVGLYATDTITGKVAKVGTTQSSPNNSGFCFQISGVDYAVTAGKTLYVTALRIVLITTSARTLNIRYADNAALTTNPVDVYTVLSPADVPLNAAMIPMMGITVPAGKYFGIFSAQSTGACTVIFWGYEA